MSNLYESARRAIDLPTLWRKYGLKATPHSQGRRYATSHTPCCGELSREDGGSLFIDKHRGEWRWRCFPCGKGGSAIDFIVGMESMTHMEAAHLLVKEAGGVVAIRQRDPVAPAPKPVSDVERMKAVKEVIRIISEKATMQEATINYLVKERGISRATIESAWKRGTLRTLPFDPNAADSWLRLNVGEPLLQASGILARRRPAAAYRPVIFIPPGGTCIEFRVASKDYSGPKALQYGEQTYPLVWMPIGKVKRIMPVEGGIDMLSVVDLGIAEETMVLGMLGVGAWQDRWVESIRTRYPESRWIMGLDHDKAGAKVNTMILERLTAAGIPCEALVPWGGDDWNDTLKSAASAF